MVEQNPLTEEVPHWKEIELFLTKNKCGNVYEIAKAIDAHWLTAQKEITKLIDIGRIHQQGKIFFLNGVDQWQKKVELNKDHTLFIDTFRTPFGENFIRIKETKKENGEWKNKGNIMITKDKISEVKSFLETVEKNLQTIK